MNTNTGAYFEYLENMKHIIKRDYHDPDGDFTVYEIPQDKVTFFGELLANLSNYGHRKFENILVIREQKKRLKFRYI